MINRPAKPNRNRFALFIITTVLVSTILYNLYGLQIVKGSEYYFDSKNSFANFLVDRAQRGIIYDRNGVKLVENVQKFRVSISRTENREDDLKKTIVNLSKIFGQDITKNYQDELDRIKDLKNINEVKIFSGLDYNPYVFQLEANPDDFPLLEIEKYSQRKYLYPELTSHIIGYTGDIDAEDYSTGKYNYGDEIGKFGLEKTFDSILRGQNGLVRIDNYSAEKKSVSSNTQYKVNGKDLYLTLDLNYQKKLYDLTEAAMKRKDFSTTNSIAAVAEDVNSGDVLAMVSYPTFNSNDFVGGISNAKYNEYLNNPGKPLSNKTTQYSQSPGSTFKLLTDMVALDEGAITKNTRYTTGSLEFGGVTFYDAARKNWGEIDMDRALCVSSNIYHMKASLALNEKTKGKASEKMNNTFVEMGLDKPSGINIGTESVGYYPTPEERASRGLDWYTGYLLNASIGQGDVRLSPVGLVKLVSTVATDGNVKSQRLVLDQDNSTSNKQLDIRRSNFDDIKEGMKCAAELNNTYLSMDTSTVPKLGLKTGTAETGQLGKDKQEIIHGWEVSFGPYDDPKIAMSVFIENGGSGWKAGYITRDFYKYALGEVEKK